jgi:hypothetical protein
MVLLVDNDCVFGRNRSFLANHLWKRLCKTTLCRGLTHFLPLDVGGDTRAFKYFLQ